MPRNRQSIAEPTRLQPRWKVYVSMTLKEPDGGELFDDLLVRNNLTRHGLAQSIGKSHTTIANVRFGRKSCSTETAQQIAGVLGVRTSLLFVERMSKIAVHSSRITGERAA